MKMFNIVSVEEGKNILLFALEYGFFLLALFLLLIIFKKQPKKIGIGDFVVVGVVILIASIRYNVGADYMSYYNYYNTIYLMFSSLAEGLQVTKLPIFIYSICYIGRNLIDNPYGFFWITSIIIYSITLFTILKRSNKPAYSILLFGMMGFLANSTNMIKQWLVIAILLYAIKYIQKDKWIHFLIIGAIALGFHQIAIAFVLLVFLAKLVVKPNMRWYRIMVIAGIALIVLFTVIPMFLKYIPFINTERFMNYFTEDITGYSTSNKARFSMWVYLVCYIPLVYIIIKNSNKLIEIDSDNKVYINMLLLSIPFIILAIKQRYAFRVAMFLDLPIVFILPLIPSVFNSEKSKKLYTIILSIIVGVFFIGYIFNRDINFAYNTYFNVM